jgi:hypothetical protein
VLPLLEDGMFVVVYSILESCCWCCCGWQWVLALLTGLGYGSALVSQIEKT